jgi:hypothetical protein
MATFKELCEGYLGISAHWHLFKYFFMFACLKDGSKVAPIGCANLQMKQGRGDKYIPSLLTSSNSGWHKWWFYLRKDPEFALPTFTGNSIANAPRSWNDGPPKAEQKKMFKDHWVMLARLHEAKVGLTTVIGQYHARGVVPLQRRPLCLCEMTASRAPWAGTVTTPELPSLIEIQRHVSLDIGKSTFVWPPQLLPMLHNEGTEKFVSDFFFRQTFRPAWCLQLMLIFSEILSDL